MLYPVIGEELTFQNMSEWAMEKRTEYCLLNPHITFRVSVFQCLAYALVVCRRELGDLKKLTII